MTQVRRKIWDNEKKEWVKSSLLYSTKPIDRFDQILSISVGQNLAEHTLSVRIGLANPFSKAKEHVKYINNQIELPE